jgi:hypothetical protein
MFASVSQATTLRFNEVRSLLAEIKRQESTPPEADSETILILRGLFFVHLYAAFEHSVTYAVQTLLQGISTVSVPYRQLEPLFHAVALDARFSAVADTGPRRKWSVRRELLHTQYSMTGCNVNDTVFHSDLQNIWFDTLNELFSSLCIGEPVLPDPRLRGYIDEVVNSRNAVAHGRESPAIPGRKRSPELETRLNALATVALHIVLCFERYFANRTFVEAVHRPNFLQA